MRKLLIALAMVVGVIVIAGVILVRSFDSEGKRGLLTSRLEAALGRQVKLGDISLGLLPPAVLIKDAQIADALGFKDPVFSTAKTFKLRVRLIPLISGRVEVPSVELDEPVIHLVKNARGEWNFASLGESGAEKRAPVSGARGQQEATAPAKGNELQIEELRLRNGLITVDDLQKRTPRVVLDRISVTVKNFVPGRAFDWEASVHPPGADSGEVSAKGTGGPVAPRNLAASPVSGRVTFRNVALEGLPAFTGQPSLSGVFDGDAQFQSDGRRASATGNYKVTKLKFARDGGVAQAPVSGQFEVSMPQDGNHLLVRRFDLTCGRATARSTGQITFGARPETELRASLANAPLADIARLFPAFGVKLPAGSSLTEGTLTAALHAFGPSAALKRSGTVEIRSARLAGYSVAGQLSGAVRLMGVDTGGRDTVIESLQLAFDGDEAYTKVPNATMSIPGMHISGQGGLDRNDRIDFRGAAVLTQAANPVGGLLQRVTGSSNTVPFQIAGTLENPSFRPDVGRIAGQQLRQQLAQPSNGGRNSLLQSIGGLFKKKK